MTADTLDYNDSGISEPTPSGLERAPAMGPPLPSDAPPPLAAHLASQPFIAPAPPAARAAHDSHDSHDSHDDVTAPAPFAAPTAAPTATQLPSPPPPPPASPAVDAPTFASPQPVAPDLVGPEPAAVTSAPVERPVAPAAAAPNSFATAPADTPATPPPAAAMPAPADTPAAAPSSAAAPEAAPSPGDTSALAAPTLPGVAPASLTAPTPPMAAPPASPTATPPTAAPSRLGGPPSTGDSTAAPPQRGRRRITIVLGLGLVFALAAAAWFGYQHFTADSGDNADATAAVAAPEGADQPDTVFDETQQLVDDINTRPELDEALSSLGLDTTGEPVDPQPAGAPADPNGAADDQPADGAAVPQDAASYAFRWSDPLGLSVTVQVDSTTGNYVATTDDGTEIRRVGDRYFGLAANSSWVELSPDVVSAIPVIGIDGVLDDSAILPSGIEQYVVATEMTTDGVVRLLVDDASLARADTALRDQWLGPWGLLDSAAPAASSFGDGVPSVASEGQVVVSIAHTIDGWVSEVTVSSPAIGGAASYSLSSTALSPLQIDVPVELAGG